MDVDEVHGWDNLPIRMIKICSKLLTLPLKLIFDSMLYKGVFPEYEKKGNIVPIPKKNSKHVIRNY